MEKLRIALGVSEEVFAEATHFNAVSYTLAKMVDGEPLLIYKHGEWVYAESGCNSYSFVELGKLFFVEDIPEGKAIVGAIAEHPKYGFIVRENHRCSDPVMMVLKDGSAIATGENFEIEGYFNFLGDKKFEDWFKDKRLYCHDGQVMSVYDIIRSPETKDCIYIHDGTYFNYKQWSTKYPEDDQPRHVQFWNAVNVLLSKIPDMSLMSTDFNLFSSEIPVESMNTTQAIAMSMISNHVIEYGYGLTFEEVCEPSPGQTICMVVWCCDKEQYLPTVVYNNGNQIVVLDMHGNEMEDHSFTEHYGFSLTHTMIGSKWNRRK